FNLRGRRLANPFDRVTQPGIRWVCYETHVCNRVLSVKRSINVRTETFKGRRPLTKVRELDRRAQISRRVVARRRPGEGHGHARRRSSWSNCGGGGFGDFPDRLHWADRFGSEHGEAQESFAALVLVRNSSRRLIDYIDRDGLPVAFA